MLVARVVLVVRHLFDLIHSTCIESGNSFIVWFVILYRVFFSRVG